VEKDPTKARELKKLAKNAVEGQPMVLPAHLKPEKKVNKNAKKKAKRNKTPEEKALIEAFKVGTEDGADAKIRGAAALGHKGAQGWCKVVLDGEVAEGVKEVEQAMADGCKWSLGWYGDFLRLGQGVEKDEKRAIELLTEASEKGNMEAKNVLGVCYDLGQNGVEVDGKTAFRLYREAAEWGHVKAVSNLGECYERGVGAEVDMEKAASLYKQAALAGMPEAMVNLGKLYLRGEGVAQDVGTAAELMVMGNGDLDGIPEDVVAEAKKRVAEGKATAWK
jgi:TPR repeat protein